MEVQYAPGPLVSHNLNDHDNFNEYHHYQQDNYCSRERMEQYIPSYDPQISGQHPEYPFKNHEHHTQELQQVPRQNQYYNDNSRGEHVLERQDQRHQRQELQQPLQLVSVDELMNHAANAKQRQQNSKRFRTAESSQETDSFGRVVTQGYLQQKSEFEARAGNRDDESGKWLVR